MPHEILLPELRDLDGAPAVAVLVAAADVAVLAIAADYPEIQDLDGVPLSPELRAALDVVEHARAVGAAIDRYKLALEVTSKRDDPMDF